MFFINLLIIFCYLFSSTAWATSPQAGQIAVVTSGFSKNLSGVSANQQAVDAAVDQLNTIPSSPNQCQAGYYASGITSSGNVSSCTLAASLTGANTWTGSNTFNPAGYTTFSNSNSYVSGTGGTTSTYASGGYVYKVHVFSSSGTFVAPSGVSTVSVLVVGPGGNGGNSQGGGGGGGQVTYNSSYSITSAQNIGVTIGSSGTSTVFGTITAVAGSNGTNGAGSGGSPAGVGGASGNSYTGGTYTSGGAGGGAGATSNGSSGAAGGTGGIGYSSSITGSTVYYGVGGGGGTGQCCAYSGSGGGVDTSTGGPGGNSSLSESNGVSASANTGDGGGGGGRDNPGGTGGSGVVIVSYIVPNLLQSIYSTGSIGVNISNGSGLITVKGTSNTAGTISILAVNSTGSTTMSLTDDGTLTVPYAVNTPAMSNLTTNGLVTTSSSNGTLGITTAPSSTIVGISDSQTITNKTFDTAANTFKVGGAPVTASEYNAGNSSTALTVNFANGIHQKVTMTGNCTFTFTAPSTGIATLTLKLVQGGSGSYTASWPSTVFWSSGTAPTLSTSVGAIDLISCYYDGTDYMCGNILNLET